jgi:xylan 1,4-beta-xylosidase
LSLFFRCTLAALISTVAAVGLHAQSAARRSAPVIGKSLRYCNPLPIEASSQDGSPQGINLGDVTVVREGDSYYMFNTGGGAWVSQDLVTWKYKPVTGARVPVAPHVVKYNGVFYMSGNNSPLYRAPAILGPYELAGPWLDETGQPWHGVSNGKPWDGAFDVDIFIDDDNKPYLYFPGRSTDGIYVVPLDAKDLTRFAAAPKHLITFNRSHKWEHWGEANEYSNIAWIEGPWVIKHNGTYYLEYSASGTQWLSYATGVYTSKSPLGPFKYSPGNPVLRKISGVVTGTGHGSVVKAPDGNWWQFYTIVLSNPPGGRRLGMDPVGFDASGNLFVHGPSETPQWAPGVVADPAHNNDSGSIPLTINKMRAMNQRGSFSSQRPGHDAAYATDNVNGTWWEPAEGDAQPSITVDLGSITEFDPVQEFIVDSMRIEFVARGRFGRGSSVPATTGPAAHQYRIETSSDGKTFTTILDKTKNTVTKYTEFEELPPTRCRFVRLTMTGWPRTGDSPFGVMEFTVFGKPVEQTK